MTALQSSNSPGPGIYLNSDYAPRPETPCSAVWTRSHTPRFISPSRSTTNIKYMTTHSQENTSFESPSIAITPSTFVRSRSAGAYSGSKGEIMMVWLLLLMMMLSIKMDTVRHSNTLNNTVSHTVFTPSLPTYPPTHRTYTGKLFESPSSPVRFFGSEILKGADNPRSFLGNLIEKAETPGPGAYVLRPGESLYIHNCHWH